jgi:class 3 adenylate cyclase
LEALTHSGKDIPYAHTSSAHNHIASVYLALEDFPKAKQHFMEALAYARASDLRGDVYERLDTAAVYNNLGELYNYQGLFDSAMYCYRVALADYERLGDRHGMAYAMGNMGTVYAQTQKHGQAKAHIDSAVQVLTALGDMYPVAVYLTYMAGIYEEAGDEGRALSYLEESLSLAYAYRLKEQIRDAHKDLLGFYERRNRYDSAFRHQRLYFAYKDSIENVDNVQRIAEMRADFEVSQKQIEVDVLEEKSANQRLLAIMLAGGVLFSLLAAIFLFRRSRERRLTNLRLQAQKEEIETQAEALQESNEEIQAINADLNDKQLALKAAYEQVQQEQAKSDALLLNILPESTAAELKATGKAVPRHYRQVSIIFTDFKGFTQLAEKITPEEVVDELNHCYRAFDRICKQYHVEKIKTIGDAYMAAAGIPEPNTTNPIDAVNCALAMMAFMEDWIANKKAKGLPAWELRLGIHTGEVIAGVVGESKFAYDIWGDTVNLAARMESSGEPNRINISKATYELVKDHFVCTSRGRVEAKNKGEVEMFFVEGPRA